MAIPNDYIDKITNKDSGESRIISPAADKVRVDNENFEGTDLDEVLDEVAQAIGESGSGDGTVTGVKVGSTTYEPTDGVVDISPAIPDTSGLATKTEVAQGLANKVDKETGKGLSSNDYTDADAAAVATIPSKANDADVVKSISVNGTAQQKSNGNVNIVVPSITMDDVPTAGSDNAVKSKGILTAIGNATPTIDPTTKKWIVGGQLTDIVAEGQDGQDGNSGVASADGIESVNNLNGGTTDTISKVYVLGANQGKRLKDQIDYVYARLQAVYAAIGNIAFWDGKPAAATILPNLDWGNPKHTVAITNNLSNSTITMNGNPVSGSFQAEEGNTVTLIVAPSSSSYALTGVSYVKDGGSSTSATSLGDGTYKIEFVMGSSDVAITVSGTAVSAYSISYTLSGCDATTRPTSIVSGSTATIVLAANQGYVLPASLPSGAVTGASVVSYTPSQDGSSATLVIGGSITGNVAIAITAGVSYAGTSVSAKKITAWPVLNSSFAPTPSDWSMTIVDDNTINCTVSANGKINIPSGYGLFSAVLTMDNVDISECIAFDTLTINVPNVTGTLALAVVVAEAVDGMFIGKSFHGSEGTTRTNPGCLVQGGVPTAPTSVTANDDWCCMSEFCAIPSTANKLKIVYGNIFKNNENNSTTQPHNKRGVPVLLNSKGKYTCHYGLYQASTTQRIVDMPAQSVLYDGDVAYIRASFIKNKLGDSALYYSTDGGTTWVQIFDGSEKNINS